MQKNSCSAEHYHKLSALPVLPPQHSDRMKEECSCLGARTIIAETEARPRSGISRPSRNLFPHIFPRGDLSSPSPTSPSSTLNIHLPVEHCTTIRRATRPSFSSVSHSAARALDISESPKPSHCSLSRSASFYFFSTSSSSSTSPSSSLSHPTPFASSHRALRYRASSHSLSLRYFYFRLFCAPPRFLRAQRDTHSIVRISHAERGRERERERERSNVKGARASKGRNERASGEPVAVELALLW